MSISRSKLNSGSTFYSPSHVPPEHIDGVCICDVQPCALWGRSCQQTRECSCQGMHEARSLSAAAHSCGSSSSSCCFFLKTKLSSVLAVRGLIATFAPFASVNRNSAPTCGVLLSRPALLQLLHLSHALLQCKCICFMLISVSPFCLINHICSRRTQFTTFWAAVKNQLCPADPLVLRAPVDATCERMR